MANIIKQLMDSDGNNIYPVTYMPSLPIGVTLLWTNDNPTSNFAAQDVALDLSDYSLVVIFCSLSTTEGSPLSSQICMINDKTYRLLTQPNTNNYNASRDVTVSSTGLSFATGRYNNANDTSRIIPQYVLGLKLGV